MHPNLCVGTDTHTALKNEKTRNHTNVQALTHKPTQRVNRSKQVGGWMDVNMAAEMATKDSEQFIGNSSES